MICKPALNAETLLQLLGPAPARVEPAAELIEEVECGTHIRRKISYLVEEGERITAYLCMPRSDNGPLPAVFCHHQHGGNRLLGKSEVVGLTGSPDQAYARELADRGYVTLAPDAICFEERADPEEPVTYHLNQLHERLVRGETLLRKVLFDVSVGIDLLQSLPEVDAGRIGFIGHSYGGRLAYFVPAVDQRIRAAVSSCGSTNYREMLRRGMGIQFEFVLPGILKHGDLEDVLRLAEPANMLLLGTHQDVWSLGIEQIAAHAASAFVRGTLECHIYPGKHEFTEQMRRHAYRFLDSHLIHNSSGAV